MNNHTNQVIGDSVFTYRRPFKEKVKVLYVDDEITNIKVFKALFKRELEIVSFHDAEEAIEYSQLDQIDVIITDQKMPKMNGLELIQKLDAHNEETGTILLTGYMDYESRQFAKDEYKVDHIITKPFNREEVLNKVIGLRRKYLDIS